MSYETLESMDIDLSTLKWEPMPDVIELISATEGPRAKIEPVAPLTMAEAKRGLAQTFGVRPEAIEITIRG